MDSEGLLQAYRYTLGSAPSSTSGQDKPEFPVECDVVKGRAPPDPLTPLRSFKSCYAGCIKSMEPEALHVHCNISLTAHAPGVDVVAKSS